MGTKITALGAIVTVGDLDELAIVDVDDNTQAASGSTKKITIAQIETKLSDTFLSNNDNISLLTNDSGYITYSDFSNDGENAGVNRDLGNLDAFALSFITSGVGRINIEAGGNVGIGTSTPSAKLNVFESINNLGGAKITNTDAGSGAYASISFQSNVGALSSFIGQNSIANAAYGGAGSLNIGTIAARPVSILTSGTSRMFVNSTGEVGIVAASANGADLALGGTIGEKLYIYDGAAPYGFGIQSNLLQSFVPAGASHAWGSGTSASFTERMRLNSTGLGIGTATPTDKLQVVGTVNATRYKVNGVAGANFGPGAVTSITVVDGLVTAIS